MKRCHIPVFLLINLLLAFRAWPVTLQQLENDPKLTPARFAKYFGNFDFVYHPEIQTPEAFLQAGSGDCDDYATLADRVLHPKGYGTRLIYVVMANSVAHTVCYVTEEKGYLDYNNRACLFKIEHSGSSIQDIADKVAKSFNTGWSIAAEYTYTNGRQHFIATINKSSTPELAEK